MITDQVKVSIITPSFNQGEFIEQTILSILNQEYSNIELIVVDGLSDDNTVDILRKYNDRIIWISERDNGQAEAINKGFKLATGEILSWLNSDDVYQKGTIERVVKYFEDHQDVDMLCGDLDIISETNEIIGEMSGFDMEYNKTKKMILFGGMAFPQPSTFFRRSVIDKVGYLDESFHYCLDVEFFVRIVNSCKIGYLKKKLASHRYHSMSKSIKMGSLQTQKFTKERLTIIKKYHPFKYYFYSMFRLFILPMIFRLIGHPGIYSRLKPPADAGRIILTK